MQIKASLLLFSVCLIGFAGFGCGERTLNPDELRFKETLIGNTWKGERLELTFDNDGRARIDGLVYNNSADFFSASNTKPYSILTADSIQVGSVEAHLTGDELRIDEGEWELQGAGRKQSVAAKGTYVRIDSADEP